MRSAKRDEVKAVLLQQQSVTFHGDKSDCTNMPEVWRLHLSCEILHSTNYKTLPEYLYYEILYQKCGLKISCRGWGKNKEHTQLRLSLFPQNKETFLNSIWPMPLSSVVTQILSNWLQGISQNINNPQRSCIYLCQGCVTHISKKGHSNTLGS